MQQHYVLLVELFLYAVLCRLLRRAEGLYAFGMILACGVQTTHFAMVKFEEVALYELAQHSIGGVGCVLQLVAGYLGDMRWWCLAVNLVPMRQLKIGRECLMLFQCTLKDGERHMERLLRT